MNANLAGKLCVVFAILFTCMSWAKDAPAPLVSSKSRMRKFALVHNGAFDPSRSDNAAIRQTGFGDCLSSEPKSLELVKAAWAFSGLKREKESSLENRVRISGWLPRLSGGVSYDLGDRWDYKYEPGEPRVDQLHQNNGLSWDAGMSLDLARTVFQVEELSVIKESSRRASERRDLAMEVIRLVFARRQLMLHGMPKEGSAERNRLDEYTAVLDAWTGGAFQNRWCKKGGRNEQP